MKRKRLTDSQILRWLHKHADEVDVMRDRSKGKTFVLWLASPKSGCSVDITRRSIRACVQAAISQDPELKP